MKKIVVVFMTVVMVFSLCTMSVFAQTYTMCRREVVEDSAIPGSDCESFIMFDSTSKLLRGTSRLATNGQAVFSDYTGCAEVTCKINYTTGSTESISDSNEAEMYYNEINDPSYYCYASATVTGSSDKTIRSVSTEHEYYVNGVKRYTETLEYYSGTDF